MPQQIKHEKLGQKCGWFLNTNIPTAWQTRYRKIKITTFDSGSSFGAIVILKVLVPFQQSWATTY